MGKVAKPKTSRESKAGIDLSVTRVEKLVRKSLPEKHVSERAPILLAGAIEHVALALLDRAADNAQDTENAHIPTKRVQPVDLIKAVRYDPDLSRAFAGFAFGSLKRSNKPINYILPADEAKERRDRITEAKENAKKKKGEEAKKKAAKSKKSSK